MFRRNHKNHVTVNPFKLLVNGIYFAAFDHDSKEIIVDNHYTSAPNYVQDFIYWHEMGHMDGNGGKRTLADEVHSDLHAASYIGKRKAIKALKYMWRVLATVNPLAAADIPSRLKELGADVSDMYIITANGKIWHEEDLRAILD